MTNTYDYASLAVTKNVDSAAIDAHGDPVAYGPFTAVVTCTYRGEPDYAEGYGPTKPMTADLSDGQTVTFTHLHPGSACKITETDDKGATSTTIVTTPSDGAAHTTDGTTATVELDPDTGAHPPNTATISNTFDVGSINVIKKVTGALAQRYGAGPFTLAVSCMLKDASGTRNVWDGTIQLGGGEPLHATISDIAAGATCTVRETDTGGATTATIDPSTPIPVDANKTATVTATNAFDAGRLIVDKKIAGDGAASAPDSFSVKVTCTAGGAVLAGFPATVQVSPGTPAVIDTLVGAQCTAVETDTGQATSVSYDPRATGGADGSAPVVITDDPQHPATITVTNTFTNPTTAPTATTAVQPTSTPPPANPPPAGTSGQLPTTGAPVQTQLQWGLALLLAGAALIALANRRRRPRNSR